MASTENQEAKWRVLFNKTTGKPVGRPIAPGMRVGYQDTQRIETYNTQAEAQAAREPKAVTP
jgi:hypothetical protein